MTSATRILAGSVTYVLRLPAFFILEKWFLSTSEEIWSQLPLTVSGLFLATLTVLLRQDELINLYRNLFGIFLLYKPSEYVQQKILGPTSNGIKTCDTDILSAFLLCTVTGLLAATLLRAKGWSAAAVVMVNNLPVTTMYLGLPQYSMNSFQRLTSAFIACYLVYCVFSSIRSLIEDVFKWINLVIVFGFYNVAKYILDLIQQQLLVFWLVAFVSKAAFHVEKTKYIDRTLSWSDMMTPLSLCVEECCRTPVGLLAGSVVVAHATPYARLLFKVFLYGPRTSRHDDGGLVEGVIFFLISIQVGVLEKHNTVQHLDVQRRVFLLKLTSLCVITLFLDTTYQMLDSKIMSFSASTKISKHIRAFMTYTLLLILSYYVVYTVCKLVNFADSLSVVIISGTTIIQILGSLLVYSLFLYDVKYSVENLDDALFYIRSTVKVLVFAGSLIITCTGLWVIKTDGLSWIQTPCLIIHSYFNVFNRFKDGYDDLILRRNSRKKIDSLSSATTEELRNHDDICSICYQRMSSAKITPCGHFYHSNCLQKWITTRDMCPLCSYRLTV